MRWKNKEPKNPRKAGDTRSRRVFAWRPTIIKKHTIWLETYLVDEVVVIDQDGSLSWLEIGKVTLDYYY